MESIGTDFPILENQKSPEIVPHILKEAAQIPLIKDREDYLKSWGLEEKGTPLDILNTLLIPNQVFYIKLLKLNLIVVIM